MDNNKYFLKTAEITKSFPGVKALDCVSIDFLNGEVHAIVGENGAGKSTLIKILSGVLQADSGDIFIGDQVYKHLSPKLSLQMGIHVIYQEFMLVPHLTVRENIFIERDARKLGVVKNVRQQSDQAKILLSKLGVDIDPEIPVSKLSTAYQQIVEIAKAVSSNCRFLIMDEPTAPLTEDEVGMLFKLVKQLKASGVTIVYISHRIEEIFSISDRVTVLRDGKYIRTMNTAETTQDELINLMVGRDFENIFPEKTYTKSSEEALRVENLAQGDFLNNVNFSLMKGEILGIGGLIGSGRTELVRAICGIDKISDGSIYLREERVMIDSPKKAIGLGIGLIPEDRKLQGVLLGMDIKDNITLPILKKISSYGVVQKKRQKKIAQDYVETLRIKTPGLWKQVRQLSGGNQQKIVVSKWLATKSEIIIFDEPTRGIDVGAKFEIYRLMIELVSQGKSIIMISSEMNELIGMSDRIAVMYNGTIRKILKDNEITQTEILKIASGL